MDWKGLLYFATGCTIGGIITWYVTKQYYEQDLDNKLKESEEWARKAINRNHELRREATDHAEEVEQENKELKEEVDYLNKQLGAVKNDEAMTDYARATIVAEHAARDYPYFIDGDIFAATTPYYDKYTLAYYQGNETLIDEETEEPVEQSIADAIGPDILLKLSADELEDTTVYVRNDMVGEDFEIEILGEPWGQDSLVD